MNILGWLWRASLATSLGISPIAIDGRVVRWPAFARARTIGQMSTETIGSTVAKPGVEAVSRRGLETDAGAMRCAFLSDSGGIDEPRAQYALLLQEFQIHNDSQALIRGERFLQKFPEQLQRFPQAEAIVADLHRRQKRGTFGQKSRRTFPADFDNWSVEKKISYLVESLDEVETHDDDGMLADRSVAKLLAIGVPSVPALIDAFETDKRLTRDVYFKGGIVGANGRITTVRDCAINAVLKILDVSMRSILPEGKYRVSDNGDEAKAVAARLRSYWRKSRQVPAAELLMTNLTDPQSSGYASREAAAKLAHMLKAGGGIKVLQNPARLTSTRSQTPTFAQAILAAMDRDLKQHLDQPAKAWERRMVEREYFASIIELGDRKITAELTRRYKATRTTSERRLAAYAAYCLGEQQPMADFARRVEAGTLTLPKNDDPNLNPDDQLGNIELRDIINDLIHVGTPEADQALFAIATPQHPYCPLATSMILQLEPKETGENRVWFCHPYCLRILRREMDDKGRTDETIRIHARKLIRDTTFWGAEGPVPTFLKDSGPGWVAAHRYDRAAERMAELIFGSPPYSALLDDWRQRLASIKSLVDRFAGRYRRLTPFELKSLGYSEDEVLYIPGIQQHTRPATKADVTAHEAIFYLDGKRNLAQLHLPAVGIPKGHGSAMDDFGRPRRFIILQAEVDAKGNAIYGVVGTGGPRVARAEEFDEIKPIPTSAP